MSFERNILITGGAGFIGSHLVRRMVLRYPEYRIVNFDVLTYAGNLANLDDVCCRPNYVFVRGDICDMAVVRDTFDRYDIDGVIHLAAESHVDRSIDDPLIFARTNVMGTLTLLEVARRKWAGGRSGCRFHHVSTDEVFGALPAAGGAFDELTRYDPHSPYSASKASSDHFVRAFGDTYGMDTVVTNCTNNYGPYQFPEKLIPLFVNNIRHRRPLPVYGNGENVRDWLFVEDHAQALDKVFHEGRSGESYAIGGRCEVRNIDMVRMLVRLTDAMLGRPAGESESLIRFVTDRAGHDLRYAMDCSKIERELGWKPQTDIEQGLARTVKWYLDNTEWLDDVTSGRYAEYYEKMYGNR